MCVPGLLMGLLMNVGESGYGGRVATSFCCDLLCFSLWPSPGCTEVFPLVLVLVAPKQSVSFSFFKLSIFCVKSNKSAFEPWSPTGRLWNDGIGCYGMLHTTVVMWSVISHLLYRLSSYKAAGGLESIPANIGQETGHTLDRLPCQW